MSEPIRWKSDNQHKLADPHGRRKYALNPREYKILYQVWNYLLHVAVFLVVNLMKSFHTYSLIVLIPSIVCLIETK